MPGSTASQTAITQIVDTMRTLAGSHPGVRPVHAKGVVCRGTFRATPQARSVSRAPHLQGEAIPTVIRFSNASGNPDAHDGAPAARAIAVKFQFPDGKNADILALSIEGFPPPAPRKIPCLPATPAPGLPPRDNLPRTWPSVFGKTTHPGPFKKT